MITGTTGAQDRAMRDAILSIDAGEILEFIRRNYTPDDVFTPDQLEGWAAENGFVPDGGSDEEEQRVRY